MSRPTPTPGVINGHTRGSPYDYTPSAGANIAFLVIFAYARFKSWELIGRILTLCHAVLGLKYRTWFFSTLFVLGGIGHLTLNDDADFQGKLSVILVALVPLLMLP